MGRGRAVETSCARAEGADAEAHAAIGLTRGISGQEIAVLVALPETVGAAGDGAAPRRALMALVNSAGSAANVGIENRMQGTPNEHSWILMPRS